MLYVILFAIVIFWFDISTDIASLKSQVKRLRKELERSDETKTPESNA